MATDPYLYPGTNTLKNLAGIKDHAELQRFEAVCTADRISALLLRPLAGKFDVAHVQAIHRYIFQDVYPWAGEFRTVDIGKQGEFWFCRPEFIVQSLQGLVRELDGENKLKGTALGEFCRRGGHYLGELNAIHPFREGNGRAQREFIRELGLQTGFHVDWRRVSQEEMYSASITSFQKGDNTSLGDLMARITLGPFSR